jgi:ribose transport system ATP-binding protein
LTTTVDAPSETPIISVRNISKTFTGKQVLRDFNLDVAPGQVHGLVGQNGSGKSTLIKILAGFHAPDPSADASLTMLGRKVSLPLRAGESARLGLAFVHQDLGLIDDATVLENVRVRRYSVAAGWRIPWSRERRYVRRILEEFGLDIDPDARVSTLRQAEKAQIAILRAYDQLNAMESGLLVLDEPTPYLPRDGVERVFQTVRDVAARKFGVLFVSHRLEEVFELTDMVTVLRDGRVVDCSPTSSLDEEKLIEKILGFSLEQLYPEPHKPRQDQMFSVEHVSGDSVDDVSFEIHKGEILGVTGLLGMGWDRLPYVLFGAEKATGGTLTLNSKTVKLENLQPADAIKLGIAFLPANRLVDGSLQTATVTENLTIAKLGKYFSGGFLQLGRERQAVDQLLVEYDVRPPDPDRTFSTLSGGNQQKVLIAKWFETNPRVLLLHEPTQGVDVGARAQIFRRIRNAAAQGAAVLLATSEYEDVPNLCDRVIVMRSGRAIAELQGSSLTTERIVEQSFRVSAHTSERATA